MKNSKNIVIMLLDDNAIDNYVNEKLIQDSQIADKIIVMETAKNALNYLKQNLNKADIPDFLLLDINLPGKNGFDFLNEFETLPAEIKEKCKIVVLSSSEKDEDIEQMGKKSLVKDYFVKPLSTDSLERIKEMVNLIE